MQAQAAEQTKIVYVRSAMVIFFQSDYGLVVLHVSRNDQSDATDRVILDPVDEKRHIRRHLANPVGVGALGNSHCRMSGWWIRSRNRSKSPRFVINDGSSKSRPQQLLDEW